MEEMNAGKEDYKKEDVIDDRLWSLWVNTNVGDRCDWKKASRWIMCCQRFEKWDYSS